MSRRPTLAAVAEAAGVSSATVDRVLNSRLPVREATALRVIKAAERIGYHGAGLMRERLRERATVRRLGFCLQKRKDPFYQAFGEAISAAAARHTPETALAVIEYMDALEPAAIAAQLLALGRKVDAVAVVAVDHPHVTAAIDTLHAAGCPVFTLLSDLSAPQRAGYVGVDNRQSGRTAAWAISRLARGAGEVGVFVGSHRYLGQETSEISFRSYLREHAPRFRVLDTLVNLEDTQLAHEATLEMLARHPELVGIYVAGGGVAGIIRALREESTPGRIVTVCNELTGEHRAALIDGVIDLVIRTPVERIADAAVRAMVRALEPGAVPMQGAMLTQPFDLFTPENV
jgi:LacI family transcriptional regulator